MIGQPPQLLAVGGDTGQRRRAALLLGGSVLAPGDPDAGDQPTQVPLPATRVGLVEIVQVDHQVPLRRGVEPEVAEV